MVNRLILSIFLPITFGLTSLGPVHAQVHPVRKICVIRDNLLATDTCHKGDLIMIDLTDHNLSKASIIARTSVLNPLTDLSDHHTNPDTGPERPDITTTLVEADAICARHTRITSTQDTVIEPEYQWLCSEAKLVHDKIDHQQKPIVNRVLDDYFAEH